MVVLVSPPLEQRKVVRHRKKHNGIRVEPTDEKRPKVEWWSIFK